MGCVAALAIGVARFAVGEPQDRPGKSRRAAARRAEPATAVSRDPALAEETSREVPKPRPIAPFVQKAIGWLAEAQHSSGGWGAGSHANQQQRDPHAVQTDPATTAFAAMALLRAGHTPVSGDHRDTVKRATEYLVKTVEEYSGSDGRITNLTGTQPQAKLGALVDTAMTAQFFARVLPTLPEGKLRDRVNSALDKCLGKLQASQKADGSWNFDGWAPVLQSSLATSALEVAQAAGKPVDQRKLDGARKYQQGNYDAGSGKAMGGAAAAGVELYSFSGAQRATASEARAAADTLDEAKREGRLDRDAELNAENLEKAGLTKDKAASLEMAYKANRSQAARLGDDALLSGFGSNGGEEYLSYMNTSESLVITGGAEWQKWNDKMHERLEKIQSPDGSWTGHHCITSPVFCTAAVVQCLTADRDAPMLVKLAKAAATAPANTRAAGRR
jgi:hypothetical protein